MIEAAAVVLFLVSIHAPTRGATAVKDKDVEKWLFQSTLPREERQE